MTVRVLSVNRGQPSPIHPNLEGGLHFAESPSNPTNVIPALRLADLAAEFTSPFTLDEDIDEETTACLEKRCKRRFELNHR